MGKEKSELPVSDTMNDDVSLFLFDRDSTLVPGSGHELPEDQLLNKDHMGPILSRIILGGHPWGILSTGNVDGAETNAHLAIRNAGIDYSGNPPVNPSISRGVEGVLNHISGIPLPGDRVTDEQRFASLRAQLNALGISHFNETPLDECADGELGDCMTCVQYGTYQYDELTGQHSLSVSNTDRNGNKIEGRISIDPDHTFAIQFGQTTLTINVLSLIQSRELLLGGDNKFFQALKAMDSLQLQIEITEQIRSLGVVDIQAPPQYRRVHPSQVTMLDDKKGVFNLMQAAGFHAILADTPEKNYETANTYISVLSERISHLPQQSDSQTQSFFRRNVAKLVATPTLAIGFGLLAAGLLFAFTPAGWGMLAIGGVILGAAAVGGLIGLAVGAYTDSVLSNAGGGSEVLDEGSVDESYSSMAQMMPPSQHGLEQTSVVSASSASVKHSTEEPKPAPRLENDSDEEEEPGFDPSYR